MVRIVVDTTGGDHCPGAPCQGAVQALAQCPELSVVLAGSRTEIERELKGHEFDANRLSILECQQTITNHDHPAMAIRRKADSAIVKGLRQVKDSQADAFVSVGSTGGILAGAILILGRLKGVLRPALVPTLPTLLGRPTVLVDCGANVDCKPAHLQQFAAMGSVYVQCMYDVQKPRVALLNIGTEAEKGNELCKAVYPKLQEMPLAFVGNVEARDMLSGYVDVVVSDAFCGNVALKSAEGAFGLLMDVLKQEFTAKFRYKLAGALLKPAFAKIKKRLDHNQYGGAPLLGVKGCVYKGHGSSKEGTCAQMILQAYRHVTQGTEDKLAQAMAEQSGLWSEE